MFDFETYGATINAAWAFCLLSLPVKSQSMRQEVGARQYQPMISWERKWAALNVPKTQFMKSLWSACGNKGSGFIYWHLTLFFYITSFGSQSGVWLYCQVFLMLSPTHIQNGICCRIVVQIYTQITFCHKAPAESCYQGKTLRKTNELKYIYRCFCNKSSEINWWHFLHVNSGTKLTVLSLSVLFVLVCH